MQVLGVSMQIVAGKDLQLTKLDRIEPKIVVEAEPEGNCQRCAVFIGVIVT